MMSVMTARQHGPGRWTTIAAYCQKDLQKQKNSIAINLCVKSSKNLQLRSLDS